MANSRLSGILKPPQTEQEKIEAYAALTKLIETMFDGNKNRMSRELGFTRNAVSFWFSKGYVGSQAALSIERGLTPIHMTMEEIRPDIAKRRLSDREAVEPPVAE